MGKKKGKKKSRKSGNKYSFSSFTPAGDGWKGPGGVGPRETKKRKRNKWVG